jgi:hypothetical protein
MTLELLPIGKTQGDNWETPCKGLLTLSRADESIASNDVWEQVSPHTSLKGLTPNEFATQSRKDHVTT